MKCEGCPVGAGCGTCLGESVPRMCDLARTRPDYRRHLVVLARETGEAGPRRPELREILAGIAGCPDRGAVLPVPAQPGCGCSELTECGRGRGTVPGRVTLQDCMACVLRRAEG